MPTRAATVAAISIAFLAVACVRDEPTVATPSPQAAAPSTPPGTQGSTSAPPSSAGSVTSPSVASPTGTGGPDGSGDSRLTGTWSGPWASASEGEGGQLELVWTQSGKTLSGSIVLDGSACLGSGIVAGKVNGSRIVLTTTQREVAFRYVGTVDGSRISGTYSTNCGDPRGTWSVRRQR